MDDTLTYEQKEYFKHSQIRDEQGNLMPVYHGSGTQFDSFDPSFTGQGADQYGSGFYFTSLKHFAEAYATLRNYDAAGRIVEKLGGEDNPTIVKVYLNIENPIYCDGINEPDLSNVLIPNEVVYDILKRLPTLYHTTTNEYEPNPMQDYLDEFWEVNPQSEVEFDYLIKKLADLYFQDTDLRQLDILFGKYGTELRQTIYEIFGYDGVVVNFKDNQHIVAWFPEQIKDVNNLAPKPTAYLKDSEMRFDQDDFEAELEEEIQCQQQML